LSKLYILKGWHKPSWIPRTYSSGITSTSQSELALFAWCMWIDMFFVGGKNCNNYSENIRRYCIKFNCQGNQACGGTPTQSWPRSLNHGSISNWGAPSSMNGESILPLSMFTALSWLAWTRLFLLTPPNSVGQQS
jgi:hypothetical protein